ncbi:Ankyrin repeat domain-containing protein 50 [Trichoderma ghanense]|uniref:Ankyrin repeat domain-containing protein 50 n=1 Tax=Trichoderma ghanense TaxID=65468 RepID=A0ABY2HBH8_9HYPO
MSDPEAYAVGWICAISTEYVAAQSLLDEKHGTPRSVARNDNNDYTLGRIGEHNVVIAVLPDGEYGIASAASVARDMLHSFPNVRIGLMVGIGGGAPSRNHDIRLGDVVVSAPRDGMGGVFQYDFGKTIQNQSFQTTGFLNQPPMVLRTAMAGLRSQYESEGHQLEATIRGVLDKKPRLRKKYSRPDPTSDRLYRSNVVHPFDSQDTCEVACGADLKKLVSRRDREEDEDNPAIHYGLIASANQLMKDAVMRDTLAAEMGVLCFEMEAAGLMNQFPCLVIRGICDYSDSHKNKEWQGYAAMTAAAYAKDLLRRIPPNKVEAEQKIKDSLSHVAYIALVVNTIDYIKGEWESKEDLVILDWVTPINYGPQHSDFFNRSQPGTGQWLLESAVYKYWLTESNETLFCPGIPGSGKTILTAIVVEDLRDRTSHDANTGLAYIYCNFKRQHEQGIEDLIASLVKQLSRKRTRLPDVVRELYRKHKKEDTRPSLDELVEALRSVAAVYSKVVVVIDALDECVASNRSRSRLLSYVSSLRTSTAVSLFATSRHVPDIEKEFEKSLKREVLASEEDMRRYIKAHMGHLPDFLSNMDDLKREIETEILQAAQGMFLLVHLNIEFLKGKTSIAEVKSTLESLRSRKHEESGRDGLRTALEQAYDEAMVRIDSQSPDQQRLGRNALEWIICAKRPLSQLELRHALAFKVKPGGVAFDPENLRRVEDIISVCAGMVTIDEESNVVRLVHYTTQEYFERRQSRLFPDAETRIAVFCCKYLSNIDRNGDHHPSKGLYNYAGKNWGHHARLLPDIPHSVREFMTCQRTIDAAADALYFGSCGWNGLHLAAFFGICKAVDFLSNNRSDLNLQDVMLKTPLTYAVENRHQDMARLLIEKGAMTDPKSKDVVESALYCAIENHDESMVRLLLAMGANVNPLDFPAPTSLDYAISHSDVSNSNEGIVRLLMEKGAKADLSSSMGQGLCHAAGCGHENVVRLLLEKYELFARFLDAVWYRHGQDARVSSGTFYAETPQRRARVVNFALESGISMKLGPREGQRLLFLAARHGRMDALQVLLQQGVALQSKDATGRTALSYAARGGSVCTIQLLLEKGLGIDVGDEKGQSPLILAAGSTEECRAAIKLLLDRGAEVDARDRNGNTPLMEACAAYEHGYKNEVIELLLDRGAAIEAKDECGKTALMKAAVASYVRLLLDRGAMIEAADNSGRTALMHAARELKEDVVEELLSRGAAVHAKANDGKTALLFLRPGRRYIDSSRHIFKSLIDSGACINERDNSGTTLLMGVAREVQAQDARGVRLLLDQGAEIEARDNQGQTALLHAAKEGNFPALNVLLDGGAVIEASDNLGQTALTHAAQAGSYHALNVLIDGGAVIEASDNLGQTALMHAACGDDLDCMRLLLDRGAAVEARDNDGKTALFHAVDGSPASSGAVELLLSRGAAVNAKDNHGRTVLSYAIKQRKKSVIVRLLRAKWGRRG